MANGIPTEKMIEIIYTDMGRIYKSLDMVNDKLDNMQIHGCAKGIVDERRIKSLEDTRKKGTYAIVGMAVGIIMNFFGITPIK